MTVCNDCHQAEREPHYGLYNLRRWCCRARHIMDAAVSLSGRGMTLADVQRVLCKAEKAEHPQDWPNVRRRLDELRERQGALL